MNQDIIEMATQAGIIHPEMVAKQLKAFAKLIRDDYSSTHAQLWLKRIEEAVAVEREACVHVCREIYSAWMCETDEDVDAPDPNDCIRAIRARGEQQA